MTNRLERFHTTHFSRSLSLRGAPSGASRLSSVQCGPLSLSSPQPRQSPGALMQAVQREGTSKLSQGVCAVLTARLGQYGRWEAASISRGEWYKQAVMHTKPGSPFQTRCFLNVTNSVYMRKWHRTGWLLARAGYVSPCCKLCLLYMCFCAEVFFFCSHTVLRMEHSLGVNFFFSSLSSCKCCTFLPFPVFLFCLPPCHMYVVYVWTGWWLISLVLVTSDNKGLLLLLLYVTLQKITLQNILIHSSWLVEWSSPPHPEYWIPVKFQATTENSSLSTLLDYLKKKKKNELSLFKIFIFLFIFLSFPC